MKYLPTIAGVLLGLLFVMSSVVVFFNLVPPDKHAASGDAGGGDVHGRFRADGLPDVC